MKKAKKYSKERIEQIVKGRVNFWKWDKSEGVFVNCWTISNHGQYNFYPQFGYKPQYKTRQEATDAFRKHLMENFLDDNGKV
jgi:hypothetical protein